MERENSTVNSFSCSLHPEEIIQRVSKDLESKQTLYCIECLMETDKEIKSTLIDLKTFVTQIYDGFSTLKPVRIDSPPPEALKETAEKSEEFCFQMIQHITAQKEKVCFQIKKVQDDFIQKSEKTKERILHELDVQLALFKKNIEDYNTKLTKYFKSDSSEPEQVINKADIISELNRCRNQIDLEIKLKSLLISLIEAQNSQGEDMKHKLIQNVKAHGQNIIKSLEKSPISFASNDGLRKKQEETLNLCIEEYLKTLEQFKNKITAFRMCEYDSEFLDMEQFSFIFSKIKPNTSFKAKKIWKASSRDTKLYINTLENFWFKTPHSLILLRKDGEIYAGYKEAINKTKNGNSVQGIFRKMGDDHPTYSRTISYHMESRLAHEECTLLQYSQSNYVMISNFFFIYPGEVIMNFAGIKNEKNPTGLFGTNSGLNGDYELEFELYELDFEGGKSS